MAASGSCCRALEPRSCGSRGESPAADVPRQKGRDTIAIESSVTTLSRMLSRFFEDQRRDLGGAARKPYAAFAKALRTELRLPFRSADVAPEQQVALPGAKLLLELAKAMSAPRLRGRGTHARNSNWLLHGCGTAIQ